MIKIDVDQTGAIITFEDGDTFEFHWTLPENVHAEIDGYEEDHKLRVRELHRAVKKLDIQIGGTYGIGRRFWEGDDEPSCSNPMDVDEVIGITFVADMLIPYGTKLEPIVVSVSNGYQRAIGVNADYVHQYEDDPLTVGELIKVLSKMDPNLHVSITTTANYGFVDAGGPVHDILIDDDGVWFYSDEML